MQFESVNPATGEKFAFHPILDDQTAHESVDESHRAFLAWRKLGCKERAAPLRRVAAHLRAEKPALARLMALEMGKPVRDGRAEVEKCAIACDWFAENGARLLAPEPVSTEAKSSMVVFNPLGVVLAIMPWNFPLWQVIRFAAPALMAGNACLLKHASNVQGCAAALEDIFRRAGHPAGIFRNLAVTSEQAAKVLAHPLVRAVTLTGSIEAGRQVAAQAGSLIKKAVLELGGSDPYLILEDADLASAAATCARSRLINAGQSCIAAKRFLVVDKVRAEFERLLVSAMEKVRPGDPLSEETAMGPLARFDLRDKVHAQVQRSVSFGAKLLLGGRVPPGSGAFYPPTVLTDVGPGMPACDDEVFGPVAAVIPVRDEAAAVALANAGRFGLGAAVFTRDRARGERIAAQELEAGNCFVNSLVKSDPRLPFGGIKESGYGRELSHFGIREFVNVKTVWVE